MADSRDQLFLRLCVRNSIFTSEEANDLLAYYRDSAGVKEGIGHFLVREGYLEAPVADKLRAAIAKRADGHVVDSRKKVPTLNKKRGAGSATTGVSRRHSATSGARKVSVDPLQLTVIGVGMVVAIVAVVWLIWEMNTGSSADKTVKNSMESESARRDKRWKEEEERRRARRRCWRRQWRARSSLCCRPASRAAARPTASVVAPTTERDADGTVLRTPDLRVRFGGNMAVDGVGITAGAGEIVGLIGTNGAGKTTLLNAIGGYIEAEGSVELLGRDVSDLRAAARARHGLGRTFQAAALFPDLTVRETLEVAAEARHRTSLTATALCLPRGFAAGRTQRALADEVIDYVGLGRYADNFISDLSTGTRRIVELAGLITTQQPVLCLDEPTAGVAQREAEAFGPLIQRIRADLDASVIVIEHDMPLIMRISDRIYCMEAGRVIAEGEPTAVRVDPRVVASYLGTDQRAIERSQPLERNPIP